MLVVPMDKGAESLQVKLETFMIETLGEYQGLTVKPTDELFGNPQDEDAEASHKRAETGFKESKDAFEARSYEDAERKLKATVKEFTKAASSLKACGHLCDAVAMYAAVLQARGDVEEAKIAILDLQALGPTFELDRKKYPQEFISLRATVATVMVADDGSIQMQTRLGVMVTYGDASQAEAKAQALTAVLEWAASQGKTLSAVDVTVPGAPTAQLAGGAPAGSFTPH